MADLAKVIKAIETHISTDDSVGCDDCTYENDGWCTTRVLSDALALLKEQEEQIKTRDESLEKAREEIKWLRGMLKEQEAKTGHWTTKRNNLHDGEWYCDQCDYEPTVFEGMPYCASCGAKMEIGR